MTLRLLPLLGLALSIGCSTKRPVPDLARIYNAAAQGIGNDRNPIILIPGVLGTKLEVEREGAKTKVWGAFIRGAIDADCPEGARTVALPMARGAALAELTDDVYPAGVLDSFEVDIALLTRWRLAAYVDILSALAAGDYTDEALGIAGVVDYGDDHYTCFQLPYDWRRDLSEEAARLHELVLRARRLGAVERGLSPDSAEALGPRVDIVAHSMGGLLLRYYLRYGAAPLPADGSLPELTWAGAQHVEQAILIGTPNAGSSDALKSLTEGLSAHPFGPDYSELILGTFPALYQLLPRTRHGWLREADGGALLDVFDPQVWQRFGWGLAGRTDERTQGWLLPGIGDTAERREVAFEHLAKSLARAAQFNAAIDLPATPPPGTELSIFVGDALDTPIVIEVEPDGSLRVAERGPGDGIVPRTSALMDERTGGDYMARLRSPARWSRVQFLGEEHLELTRSPEFTDNLLWMLLEASR